MRAHVQSCQIRNWASRSSERAGTRLLNRKQSPRALWATRSDTRSDGDLIGTCAVTDVDQARNIGSTTQVHVVKLQRTLIVTNSCLDCAANISAIFSSFLTHTVRSSPNVLTLSSSLSVRVCELQLYGAQLCLHDTFCFGLRGFTSAIFFSYLTQKRKLVHDVQYRKLNGRYFFICGIDNKVQTGLFLFNITCPFYYRHCRGLVSGYLQCRQR